MFAGPRDDAFFFDSGATFDTLNFRAPAPVLTGAADTGTGAAYPNAVDGFAGYNISLIALELPITAVTSDGKVPTTAARPTPRSPAGPPPCASRSPCGPAPAIRCTSATTFKWIASAIRSRWRL